MKKKVSASFSSTREFLALIDHRAESLGLSRSTYLEQLVRRDLGLSHIGHGDPDNPASLRVAGDPPGEPPQKGAV